MKDIKATRHLREKKIRISNPGEWPEDSHIVQTMEPMVLGTIITPGKFWFS